MQRFFQRFYSLAQVLLLNRITFRHRDIGHSGLTTPPGGDPMEATAKTIKDFSPHKQPPYPQSRALRACV